MKKELTSSKYLVIDSGCALSYDYSSDFVIRVSGVCGELDIIAHFIFINDNNTREMSLNARIDEFNIFLMCTNFRGALGSGIIEPLEIGQKNGKKYYFRFWISDIGVNPTSRKIDYTLYVEK